ncbi:MAG: GNAT family N-acetyltransferase [Solirubrobacteraceae bacterium]
MIRAAGVDELGRLRAIEREAGAMFRSLGMDAVADDEPLSLEALRAFQSDGRAWVYVDGADAPLAYLLVEVIDAAAHIEQVSVHPQGHRQGLGRALIGAAAAWARERGLTRVTLTTYRDVLWNAAYYERLGFTVIPNDQLTQGLRELRRQEAAAGLDQWPRVVMQLLLEH